MSSVHNTLNQKLGESELQKAHGQLVEMLCLLQKVYQPNKQFQTIFKRDMFFKSNKAAFQEVIFYLFYTLNPEDAKIKVHSYPSLDTKMDARFRTEIINYSQELRKKYPDTNIPMLRTSDLVTPYGSRIITFLLAFAQLSIKLHLEKNLESTECLLGPLKPGASKAEKACALKNMNIIMNKVEKDNSEMLFQEFYGDLMEHRKFANEISEDLAKVQEIIKNTSNVKIGGSTSSDSDFEEEIELVKRNLQALKNTQRKFAACAETLKAICRNDYNYEYEADLDGKLNLVNHFKTFNDLIIEKISSDLGFISPNVIRNQLEEYSHIKNKLEGFKQVTVNLEKDIETFSKHLENNML